MLKSEDAVLKTVQDDDSFSKTQEDFYPRTYLHTNKSYLTSPISLKKISNQINGNYEDRIYVKDTFDSLNYIGKPIINTELYEFTCHENKKKYLARKDSLDNIKKECYFLNKLVHKNILNWERYITDDSNTYILYENCGNLTLEEYLNQKEKLPEYEVRFIITELVNLLKYLKSKNVIHRKLRLSNIIVTEKGKIKVMGFETAVKLKKNHNVYEELCNIFYDFIPEFEVNHEDYNSGLMEDKNLVKFNDNQNNIFPNCRKMVFSFQTDLWAVGRIMYYLLVGKEPVIEPSTNIHDYSKSLPDVSCKAADCLRRLLEPDSKKRQKLNLIFITPFFE